MSYNCDIKSLPSYCSKRVNPIYYHTASNSMFASALIPSVTVCNSQGYQGGVALIPCTNNILVQGTTAPPPGLTILPSYLPNSTVSSPYSQTLTCPDGTGPFTFSYVSGVLPYGVTISSSGLISGTPTDAGQFIFSVGVVDNNGITGGKNYSINIQPLPTTTTTTPNPTFGSTTPPPGVLYFTENFTGDYVYPNYTINWGPGTNSGTYWVAGLKGLSYTGAISISATSANISNYFVLSVRNNGGTRPLFYLTINQNVPVSSIPNGLYYFTLNGIPVSNPSQLPISVPVCLNYSYNGPTTTTTYSPIAPTTTTTSTTSTTTRVPTTSAPTTSAPTTSAPTTTTTSSPIAPTTTTTSSSTTTPAPIAPTTTTTSMPIAPTTTTTDAPTTTSMPIAPTTTTTDAPTTTSMPIAPTTTTTDAPTTTSMPIAPTTTTTDAPTTTSMPIAPTTTTTDAPTTTSMPIAPTTTTTDAPTTTSMPIAPTTTTTDAPTTTSMPIAPTTTTTDAPTTTSMPIAPTTTTTDAPTTTSMPIAPTTTTTDAPTTTSMPIAPTTTTTDAPTTTSMPIAPTTTTTVAPTTTTTSAPIAPTTTTTDAPTTTPAPLEITPVSLPDTTLGLAYSETLTPIGGTPPYNGMTISSGSLPLGLSFNPTSSSATISGTSTVAGTYNFVLQLTDSGSSTVNQPYIIIVNP